MALGPVNVPGATGKEVAGAVALANQANENARAAEIAAGDAQAAADAALTSANAAQSAADAANTAAEAAQETADAAQSTASTAKSTAEAAQTTANAASTAANNAATAAANAQAAADAANQAVTDLNSTINGLPTQNGTITYDGNSHTPSWNGYDTGKLSINVTARTNAGDYSATFTPKTGYKWWDGTTTGKTASWSIEKAPLTLPAQSGTLTYTGNSQTPSWNSNYDSNKMTLSVTAQTNYGTYNASFTPKSNYMWSDGTTAAKTAQWSIGKAAGSLSLSPTSMSLNVSSLTGDITVTRAGDGTISAKSSNTSVATVSVSGTKVTVTGKAAGSATITVSVAAGTNHTAPSDKTCSVTVTLPSKTLADNTPATIKAVGAAGTGESYWKIGDKIGIALSGTVGSLSLNDTYYAFIIGFNHNSSREGNGIHFQFGKTSAGADIAFCDSSYNSTGSSAAFRMNTTNTNSGGWNGSYMRKTICPAFLNAMPSAWQSAISACTKYSDNTGGGNNTASYVTSTSDKIWLLSEFEVQGSNSYANSAEKNYQAQYAYYANGNSKVKNKHNATTTACIWWLRSVYATDAAFFCRVYTDGGAYRTSAYYSFGFAPGFKAA